MRVTWLAVLAVGLMGVGVAVRLWRPADAPALPCPPEQVRQDAQGVARCAGPEAGQPLPAGAVLGLGAKLDLNAASEADLALVPGLGKKLAEVLVETRRRSGGFRDWSDVDAVPGVGPTKLALLQRHTEIR